MEMEAGRRVVMRRKLRRVVLPDSPSAGISTGRHLLKLGCAETGDIPDPLDPINSTRSPR